MYLDICTTRSVRKKEGFKSFQRAGMSVLFSRPVAAPPSDRKQTVECNLCCLQVDFEFPMVNR